ncbi:MAG: HAD family hydrolase, partial [Candidatus Hydrothermarchaeales archaeon]
MKLAVFDMDGTLLEGRTIFYLAEEFDFLEKAQELIESDLSLCRVSEELAKLLKGVALEDALDVARGIPLMRGVEETISRLRDEGFKLAIVTESY